LVGSGISEGDMSDRSNSETVIPSAPLTEAEKPEDLTGQNVLGLLHQATDLAGGNSRYAVEIAQKLSDQLGLAEK
jgi:hypothetical protein